jgi:alpha-beta hydrolase superfamily lysophospholipase
MKELQISILQEKNNTLHGVIWATDEQPKAVLQITHGMTEHIQRYKELAENLNKYGIVVAGFDLRGHGRNLSNTPLNTFQGVGMFQLKHFQSYNND